MAGQVIHRKPRDIQSMMNGMRRLVLIDATQPFNKLEVLFNPTTLGKSVSVAAGRLHPVGSSHPVKQYAHTDELKVPLELYWSEWHIRQRGVWGVQKSVTDVMSWLASFCFPLQNGMAPAPVIIVWPKTLTTLVTVDSYSDQIMKWDTNGTPLIARITLDVSELRREPRYRGVLTTYGWQRSDQGHTVTGVGSGFRRHLIGKTPAVASSGGGSTIVSPALAAATIKSLGG